MSESEAVRYGARVQGWYNDEAGARLAELAQHAPGEIVELGTAWGKSISYILAGTDRDVTCVDIWDDADPTYGTGKTSTGESAWGAFDTLLGENGWTDRVTRLRMTTQEAAKGWTKPIGLLHVDADHSYEGVLTDYENWSPFIVSGGYIVFDDMQYKGPSQVVNDHIVLSSEWTDHYQIYVQFFARRS